MLDELIKEARGWLSDIGMPLIASEKSIISMVHIHHEGGWLGFVECDPSMDPAAIYLLMVGRYELDFANRLFWLD